MAGDPALAKEDTFSSKMLGDPCPIVGFCIKVAMKRRGGKNDEILFGFYGDSHE